MDSALITAPAKAGVAEELGVRAPARARAGRLRPRTAWALACLAVDTTTLVLAALATWVAAMAAGVPSPPAAWSVAFALLCVLLFESRGLYAHRIQLPVLDDIRAVLVAAAVSAMSILTLRLLLGHDADVAADSVRPFAFAVVFVSAGRAVLYWSQARARRTGPAARATLIVGAGRIGCLIAKRLIERPELGLRPVAFLDEEPLADPLQMHGLPVARANGDLDSTISQYGVEQVIVTFTTAPDEELLGLVRRCDELGVAVAIVPRLFERVPEHTAVEHLGGIPLVTLGPVNPKGLRFAVKYAIDRAAAALLLLVCLPLLAAVALAVRLTMGRPVLFRQVRVGRDGRRFDCLKFRSMRPEPPRADPRVQLPDGVAPGGVEGDDRRTVLGALLRRTSVDELPQLLNVLRGEMSLVGPRPERPEFVSRFEQSVYRYGDRHRVKSGLTGWAQVNGLRGQTSIADRAEWDNYYIENFSLWLDLKILFMTAKAVLGPAGSVQ